ncbi:serine/threonine protein kinase [Thalassoroseus pseudoceratinae]|uniref:serine/threonine protein kinase n=1 Tax=Thalassoroseus pseudoceratinae TaxID=2713176 RepID=UPI00141E5CCF|nr:serine/threonine-protein kinase [Thalassoroseus pseudoceratinae]
MDIEQIGPYQIDRKIGSGGMGTVYLASHEETGEQVALKTLSPALARESGFVQRFHQEIHSLAQLTNPHVVRLIDSGADNDIYYYAMEYVEGETVTQRLRKIKKFPWEEVVDIGIQVCSALKAAHDAGIIHRDIKPSNLLLDPEGQVKLTDFGIAKLFAAGKLTATDGIIGTAEYMSPEQAQGKQVTSSSDLYSLGAVMYTMLTGRPPYTGKTALEVIQKHKFGQFDRPARYVENLPHWLDEIICGLLSKSPEDRPPSAYVLSRRLSEVLKKVELSESDETRDAPMANTSAVATAPTQAPEEQVFSGALVRDLVRRELDDLAGQSPIERFFDNTWVLVGLLVALVAGGIWWFQRKDPTPVDRPTKPIVNAPDKNEAPTSRQAITRLNIWLQTSPTSEAAKYVENAVLDLHDGNLGSARQTLDALDTVIESSKNQELMKLRDDVLPRVIKEIDVAMSEQAPRIFPPEFIRDSMRHANELAEMGRVAEAREIWNSIVQLCEAEPMASELIRDVQARLADSQPAPSAEITDP